MEWKEGGWLGLEDEQLGLERSGVDMYGFRKEICLGQFETAIIE